MKDKSLLYEYDEILLGNKNSFSNYLFGGTEESKERLALQVFRCAIENYLRWTPAQARDYLNEKIIEKMKLDTVIKHIRLPVELDPSRDYFYIAHLLYPEKVRFDRQELVIRTYQDVLDGKLIKYPKEYLSDTNGYVRSRICLQYMISQYVQVGSIKELYELFATVKGKKLLEKYRLLNICNDAFGHPLDYLHESLPTNLKDELEYKYQYFYLENNNQIRKMKKDNSFVI